MNKVAQQLLKDKGVGKLAFLGLVSASLSSFLPIFAPVPMVLASLQYGRVIGLIFGIVCSLFLIGMSMIFKVVTPFIYIPFVISFIFSLMVSESFFRKISPVKGIIYHGLFVIAVLVSIWGGLVAFTDFSLSVELKKVITEVVDSVLVKNPDLFPEDKATQIRTDMIKAYTEGIPAAIVTGIFITLWLSFFVILRNSAIWLRGVDYPYTVDGLIKFKVPYHFVWPLIASLALMLLGDKIAGKELALLGENVLYMLGVFYFFQGFGIYIDLLNKLKIYGFLRSMFIIITVVLGFRLVAVVGMFDMWFDIRKFFDKFDKKSDNNVGDE